MAHEKIYNKLAEKYEFMRRRTDGLTKDEWEGKKFISNLYDAFGCEFGPGWYDILDELCSKIQKELDSDPELKKVFMVDQVKEKFAGLRFYVSCGNDKIYEAIFEAEKQSMRTCEECGKGARIKTSNSKGEVGYYRTLCAKCAKEQGYYNLKPEK